MPADPADTYTLTTHPDHLAADEVVCTRHMFDGRVLEQTRAGEWRDVTPRPADDVPWLRSQIVERERLIAERNAAINKLHDLLVRMANGKEALKAQLADQDSRLARAEAIEGIAQDIVHWWRATEPHNRGTIGDLVERLEAVLPSSEKHEDSNVSSFPDGAKWTVAHGRPFRLKGAPPEPVSSSDPCPDCGSSRWTPNGESYVFPYVLPPAKPKPDRSTGEDARQSAIDGDAQRRHGRQQRLIVAARELADWMGKWHAVSPGTRERIDNLCDVLDEFGPADVGPVAVETEAEPADPRGWYIDVDNCRVVSPSGVVYRLDEKVQTPAEREVTRLREEVALLTERLETRIKMTEQLHGICDDRERAIAERNTTIADLRSQLAASHGTIAELEAKVGSAEYAKHLQAELAKWEAWSAETARRCEAVVRAVEGLVVGSTPASTYWRKFYTPIEVDSLAALRHAVDALRPATATEVRA